MTKYISVILMLLSIVGCGEREGLVKWTDCREKIHMMEGDFSTYFKKFTCEYYKTGQGRIMGGNCVSIDYDSNGSCRTAYLYEKRQENVCSKQNPILRVDDLCYPK